LIPCENQFKKLFGCGICLTVERIKVFKGMLIGTPILDVRCQDTIFERFTGWYMPLIRNASVVCPSSELQPTTFVLIGLIAFVAFLISSWGIYECVIAARESQQSSQNVMDDEFLETDEQNLNVNLSLADEESSSSL